MSLFFFFFFAAYGCMHLYFALKLGYAVTLSGRSWAGVTLYLLFMIAAPVLVRYAEKYGFGSTARLLAFTGYLWMGFLLLFCSAALLTDLYRLALFLAGLVLKKELSHFILSPAASFLVPFTLPALICAYAYFEALNLRIERVVIRSGLIPPAVGTLKLVQISDVHLGLIIREERLKKVLDIVAAENPDILVATGDLVDGQINGLEGLAEQLRAVRPRYGKFAVTGNHEYFAGIGPAVDFIRKSGFTVLRGEGYNIEGVLNIAGVDDPAGKRFGIQSVTSESEMLAKLPRKSFTVLLKHRPVIEKASMDHFNLQLSGHVHRGQIYPFVYIVKMFFPVETGLTKLDRDSSLYVSRGTGTWGPPLRFLAPPEVTVFELKHAP